MATYYVETYRPNPGSLSVRAYRERDYCRDVLSPSMTSVWRVDTVRNKEQAIAAVIEKAAGKGVAVSRVF